MTGSKERKEISWTDVTICTQASLATVEARVSLLPVTQTDVQIIVPPTQPSCSSFWKRRGLYPNFLKHKHIEQVTGEKYLRPVVEGCRINMLKFS
jgi:hypothetical protein